jgi:tetratricopeptide (TPR) repeat protein
MEFVCPVCQTAGDTPDDSLDRPATQTTCQKCGTPLSLTRETGQVDVLSSARNPSAGRRPSSTQASYETTSVLSMRSQDRGKKDYASLVVFAVVLAVLVATGVYLTLNLDRGVFKKPLQSFSKLADDLSRYGKTILSEFQKVRQPKSKQTRRAQKHVREGYDHYKENRLGKAQEELGKAIEINPQNPEAYFWRARTFIKTENYDEAIMDLKTVIELNPRYSPAYDNLGWLFMRRNKDDESLAYLNRSIELKPNNGWAHYMRSRIFFKKGDLRQALENAKTACKLDYADGCRDVKRYESNLSDNS